MLDTIHAVETPEGVRLTLRAAGPVPRGLAFLVDGFIRSMLYFGALLLFSVSVGGLALPLFVIVLFLGEWLYPVFFEVWAGGQTPGKRALGLRVVNDDGTPVGWGSSLLRNLLLAADWLPASYLSGLLSMLTSASFRRLGDHAAGTLVTYTAAVVSQRHAVPDVLPLAPPVELSVEEQRAVLAFAERSPLFSEARRRELALLAQPLHGGAPDPEERLLRNAAWLLGRGVAGERR